MSCTSSHLTVVALARCVALLLFAACDSTPTDVDLVLYADPPLYSPPDVEPAWSRDGSTIAYVHVAQNWEDLDAGLFQIWLYSIETGTSGYLTSGGLPDWSPSGDSIAYVLGSDIWVIDLVTRSSQQITFLGDSYSPRWSPDSDRILFKHWTEEELSTIWTCHPDGSDLQNLHITCPSSADWDPSGSKIVSTSYGSTSSSPPHPQVVVFDLISLDSVTLTEPPMHIRYPEWSPSGNHIAFLNLKRFESGPAHGLWIVDPDGNNLRFLVPNGSRPSWSPGGAYLVYENQHESLEPDVPPSLFVVSVETGEATPLSSFKLD